MLVSDFPKRKVHRINGNNTVSEAISLMEKTSPRALFVFENKTFKGVVTQKELLGIVKPHKTKISAVYRSSPKLSPSTTVEEAARLMVENDLEVLPLMKNKQITGAVVIDDVLKALVKGEFQRVKIKEIGEKEVVTVNPQDKLMKAYEMFKKYHFSCLPVTKNKKLVGIIIYDTIAQIFGKPQSRLSFGEFTGEKIKPLETPIFSIMDPVTATSTGESTLKEAIDTMLKNHISHLVITDTKGKVQGILTKKDVLRYILAKKEKRKLRIQFSGDVDKIEDLQKEEAKSLVEKLNTKIGVEPGSTMFVNVKVRGTNENPQFIVKLRLSTPKSRISAEEVNWAFDTAFETALSRIERQVLKKLGKERTLHRQETKRYV